MKEDNGCPGCSGTEFAPTHVKDVVRCKTCGGIISRPGKVVPAVATLLFVKDKMKGGCEHPRYFDFTYRSEAHGDATRVHGWYDPADGMVVQYG